MELSNKKLKELLVNSGQVSQVDFQIAEKKSQTENLPLQSILIGNNLIRNEQLGQLIADDLKLPFITLNKTPIPPDVLHILPQTMAQSKKIIVFAQDKKETRIATSNPQNTEIIQFISKKTNTPVKIYYTTDLDIEQTIYQYEKDIQKHFDDLLAQNSSNANQEKAEIPIIELVNLILEYAFEHRVSDIHIEPHAHIALIRLRIDGVLHDITQYPKNIHDQLATRIKVMAKLRTDEHFSAQDGKFSCIFGDENTDFRVSIIPIVAGEKIVLRLLSSHSQRLFLPDLGINQEGMEKIKNAIEKPYGMILATGPTGSGKTSTIYAILSIINTREKNITSIEDPIEYSIDGANQIQVNPKTNLTFASGLRAILRQDPNIIFVGEIRDKETASIAVNSALTGHLVLSTIHTNNSASTLPRLIDMEIEPFLITSTVNIIIAQRLIRKICEQCRVSIKTNSAQITKSVSSQLVKKYFGNKKENRLYQGKGCKICHFTGYSGRIGIYEILEITDPLRALIMAKANAVEIENQAKKDGMQTMMEDGLKKVIMGVTSIEELLRVTKQ